ncbi:MAG: lactonase family protein [Gemmatales bacterium]
MVRLLLLTVSMSLFSGTTMADDPTTQRIYFGTYTARGSEGIYVAELDGTGKLSEPRLAAKVANPSFLALHPNKKWLYAVSEVETTEGKKGGGVTAFRINESDGTLSKINSQLTGGGAPCHLSLDKTGKCVMVANYSGGSVNALPIKEDGSLGEAASFVQHTGKSIDKQRQEGPHAHSINVSPDNRFAFAADLGTDEIRIYRLDAAHAKLTPHQTVQTPAGGGPRHFAFHPNGRFAYSNNEMTSSVTTYRYDEASFDATTGMLKQLETVSTLPGEVKGNSTAEVKVHPTGKFVYVSNRGHNSIAIFAVKENGSLEPLGHASTGGKTPRNFNLCGNFLLAANQDTGNVVVFRIDEKTGGLTPTGSSIKVPMPVCVLPIPR